MFVPVISVVGIERVGEVVMPVEREGGGVMVGVVETPLARRRWRWVRSELVVPDGLTMGKKADWTRSWRRVTVTGVKGCRRSHRSGRNKLVRRKSLSKRVM